MSVSGQRTAEAVRRDLGELGGNVPHAASDVNGPRRSLWTGVLFATAVFTIVDETLLHLLLHWHHFYDRSSPGAAMLADGIFQSVGLIALVSGVFLFADLLRRQAWWPSWQLTGLFLGLAVIGLFDEVVVHKILRFHQIHYGPGVEAYDAGAVLCIVVATLLGVVFLRRARRETAAGGAERDG